MIEEIVNLKKDLRFDKKKSAPDLKLIYSLPFELRKGYQKRKAAIYNSKTKTARDFSQNKIKEMEAFKEENIEWMEKKKKWLEERAEKRMEKKRKRIKEMILKRKEEREKKIKNGEYFKYSAFVVDFEKEREPSYDSDGKPKPKEKFYVPFKQKNEEEILEELKKEREELRLKFSHDAIKLHSARVGKSIKIRNEETMKRIRR